tara:strand:+ start:1643 stop:2725 length:1083 start_codon:yes stop_codon:yes gene_type:complete
MKKIDLKNNFRGKKVIITGHTGFKGSWLVLWLHHLGSKIVGISNNVPTKPSMFEKLNLKNNCKDIRTNIKDLSTLKKILLKEKPDYLFHLAAQSLVKKSYFNPINTFETNTLGTLNILESLTKLKKKCTVVLITSDKSYKNLEKKSGYKENDILGGHDPYSASKGSAEIIIQSYIKSFYKNNKNINIAVARAGNVIGGGDWSSDRLIPDCVKSWSKNKLAIIRNPSSTRPWQHVLEALGGYLILAIKLKKSKRLHGEAFNFGPSLQKQKTVLSLIKIVKKFWLGIKWKLKKKENFYETKILKLNCSKSKKYLNWKCVLKFEENIEMLSNWYKLFYSKNTDMKKFSIEQIKKYQRLMSERL